MEQGRWAVNRSEALALEIEIKVEPPDVAAVRRRLVELGALRHAPLLEINTLLDTPEGRLRAADQGLRVRLERRLDAPADDDRPTERATLTWKGPRSAGAAKVREELETPVGDADAAVGLLASIGFQPRVIFEKRREPWSFCGCMVCIDSLPGLPELIEIEGPSETAVRDVRNRLGLGDAPLVDETYVAMAARLGRRRPDGTIALRFEAATA